MLRGFFKAAAFAGILYSTYSAPRRLAKTPDLRLIVKKCIEGDENAFKQFYQHFYGYAMSICSAYAQNGEDVREIMNDGFLKVFAKLHTQQHPDNLAGWLRAIMVNTAIDHYRRSGHLHQSIEHTPAPASAYGDEAIYAHLSADEILHTVQSLSTPHRLVFSLYVIEGYSHREIGEKLAFAESTSRAYLSEANTRLRHLLTLKAHNADA